MNEATQHITYSKVLNGFPEWFAKYFPAVKSSFTIEAEELFETLENFAVELYLTLKVGD
jgi:inosine/xanthosine triphosphate pyrophosphatase family protein